MLAVTASFETRDTSIPGSQSRVGDSLVEKMIKGILRVELYVIYAVFNVFLFLDVIRFSNKHTAILALGSGPALRTLEWKGPFP